MDLFSNVLLSILSTVESPANKVFHLQDELLACEGDLKSALRCLVFKLSPYVRNVHVGRIILKYIIGLCNYCCYI